MSAQRIRPPAEVESNVGKLVRRAERASKKYRFIYELVYGAGAGSGIPVQAGDSDPTGEIVADDRRNRFRRALEGACRSLDDALAAVEAFEDALARATRPVGLRNPMSDQRRYPPRVNDLELGQLRAAQRRRRERGEL